MTTYRFEFLVNFFSENVMKAAMNFLESKQFISLIIGAIIASFGFVAGLYTQSTKSQIECERHQQTRLLTKTIACETGKPNKEDK